MSDWTLFSNHGHVLVCLARDPDARLRDVAAAVGITERAVQKIVRDLQQGGMLSVSKQGRCNQYRIHRKAGLRHPLESDSNVGGLVDFVGGEGKSTVRKETDKLEAEREAAEKKAAEKRAAAKKAAEQKAAEERAAEKKAAQKARKEAKEKAKEAAKSEIEKQQGSLF